MYLAASRDDPCSNALLEALACGLPAVFLRSGGHPELVGEAGLGFDEAEELPPLLDRLVGELGERRAAIRCRRSPTSPIATSRCCRVMTRHVGSQRHPRAPSPARSCAPERPVGSRSRISSR